MPGKPTDIAQGPGTQLRPAHFAAGPDQADLEIRARTLATQQLHRGALDLGQVRRMHALRDSGDVRLHALGEVAEEFDRPR